MKTTRQDNGDLFAPLEQYKVPGRAFTWYLRDEWVPDFIRHCDLQEFALIAYGWFPISGDKVAQKGEQLRWAQRFHPPVWEDYKAACNQAAYDLLTELNTKGKFAVVFDSIKKGDWETGFRDFVLGGSYEDNLREEMVAWKEAPAYDLWLLFGIGLILLYLAFAWVFPWWPYMLIPNLKGA